MEDLSLIFEQLYEVRKEQSSLKHERTTRSLSPAEARGTLQTSVLLLAPVASTRALCQSTERGNCVALEDAVARRPSPR